jgi:AraC-like DNA-binding protein
LPDLPTLPSPGRDLPLWPPLLATRGPGSRSARHAHHAMHFALGVGGPLRARAEGRWSEAAGFLAAADRAHEIDARDTDVLLVFLDPESDAGAALAPEGPLRPISDRERDPLLEDPGVIMGPAGPAWIERALKVLGVGKDRRRPMHPRVRKLLRILGTDQDGAPSLDSLAAAVGLSPGRLMHVFTASIGIPLRPYLAWLKLQRAAGAIVSGMPLTDAAHAAGFADAAHMSRTFRRTFGVSPSQLRSAGGR